MVFSTSSIADDNELVARYSEEYLRAQNKVMLDIERSVCGCDYGGTSWMTQREALQIGEMLNLAPGKHMLEVGAGSGWPGLYLAGETGCDVTLVDLPFEGLKIASKRAATEGLTGNSRFAVADGAALPLNSGCFDAVIHSDVLCCLKKKLSVLKECRRVLGDGGTMVFTVLLHAPNLSPADYARATDTGPPHIQTTQTYQAMMEQAGWEITKHTDLSAGFRDSIRRLLIEEDSNGEALRKVLGDKEYVERLDRRRLAHEAVEDGLILREMFSAV